MCYASEVINIDMLVSSVFCVSPKVDCLCNGCMTTAGVTSVCDVRYT